MTNEGEIFAGKHMLLRVACLPIVIVGICGSFELDKVGGKDAFFGRIFQTVAAEPTGNLFENVNRVADRQG